MNEIAEAIAIGVGNGCRAESVSQEEAAKLLDPFTGDFRKDVAPIAVRQLEVIVLPR